MPAYWILWVVFLSFFCFVSGPGLGFFIYTYIYIYMCYIDVLLGLLSVLCVGCVCCVVVSGSGMGV